ncbi:MAG: hypothetical protein L0Y68_04010 [Candidatus Dadabacteria bacterium]|nr:hypothetical protein [Candidatus Dadabacteria bacterium]
MDKVKPMLDSVDLSFGLESSATLWNVVFKGFDEEVTLVSRFDGKEGESIKAIHKFGNLLRGDYDNFQVELTNSGILIKKTLPTNDISTIRKWSELMHSIKDEMASILNGFKN